jgi:hypothetical protein
VTSRKSVEQVTSWSLPRCCCCCRSLLVLPCLATSSFTWCNESKQHNDNMISD